MRNTFKFKSAFIVLAAYFLSMSISFADENQDTMITLYNLSNASAPTLAVLRQVNRKIEFFSCRHHYTGTLNDNAAVIALFSELDSSGKKMCIKMSEAGSVTRNDGSAFVGKKFAIKNESGLPKRYIYSQLSAVNNLLNGVDAITTSGATFDVDVYDGLEVSPESEVLITYVGIHHSHLNNPTNYSGRLSHKLSGMALIKYPTIQD